MFSIYNFIKPIFTLIGPEFSDRFATKFFGKLFIDQCFISKISNGVKFDICLSNPSDTNISITSFIAQFIETKHLSGIHGLQIPKAHYKIFNKNGELVLEINKESSSINPCFISNNNYLSLESDLQHFVSNKSTERLIIEWYSEFGFTRSDQFTLIFSYAYKGMQIKTKKFTCKNILYIKPEEGRKLRISHMH
ncbi:MAG: hypothetical protein U0V49_02010 [Saprospiraceae bacterium]